MAKGDSQQRKYKEGRMCNTLKSPEIVLSILAEKSKDKDFKFKRLYRNLYNVEFYQKAYFEMASKEGNLTEGTDGKNIDGIKLKDFEQLVNKLRDFSYQPNPVRRTYIPKKSNPQKTRPLGIPSIEDKVVQYAIKYILEAIYEEAFSVHSHGFRPNRSCHTALREIKSTFKGFKWFVEGDIKSFFDNIDHHVLAAILRKRISDENFLGLIWKFLRAGYMEEWEFHKTFSGTPQGGIISPILANIYLNELDCFMDELCKKFSKGKPTDRKLTKQYVNLNAKIEHRLKKNKLYWDDMTQEERQNSIKEIEQLRKERAKYPVYEPLDNSYKKIAYVRYADDFLIAVQGSKEDAVIIKKEIKVFLAEQLKLELSEEKTLITHSSDKARFLGYDITVRRDNAIRRDKNNVPKKAFNYSVGMYIPYEIWRNKLLNLGVLRIVMQDGKEKWEPIHRPELICVDDLEILSTYNAEIRGYYNYYQFADNSTVLQKFKYIMEYSMYKTYAAKYRTSIGKVKSKFCIDGSFSIRYQTENGEKIATLYNAGFAKQNILKTAKLKFNDTMPDTKWVFGVNSLVKRLKAKKCELCGAEDVELEMHHVKKLKNLKGKEQWEKVMISKKRKTLAVCHDCHSKITAQQRVDSQNAEIC